MNMEADEVEAFELEEQFILRLPLKHADVVRKSLKLKTKKFKKTLKICFNEDNRSGLVFVKKHQLHAKVVDLPCLIDSNKTTDNSLIFKTANVSQMLICQEEKFGDDLYAHGMTPPLKNAKKRRFRKVLRNEENLEDIAEIEKEVIWLLRADNEAVSTRFEYFFDDKRPDVSERALFGETITDSDTERDSASSKSYVSENYSDEDK